jgi:hypothetical protein
VIPHSPGKRAHWKARGLWNLRRCGWIDPAIVRSRRRTPVKRDANIKSRILGSLNSFVLAASRRTYRQGRAFRVVSHLWAMATVRPLRFLGVLLVLYAIVGSNLFSPAEVPADAVRVLLWLFASGVVALIVDEVCERITRAAGEVRNRKQREREQKPN